MMQVVEPPKAVMDFQNKTIQFQGEFKLSDVQKIQESLKDWESWRIVTVEPPRMTVTSGVYQWPQTGNETITCD